MYKLYGIPNCDTVKKARTYLEKKKIAYEFVDFKKYTPTKADIERWEIVFGDLPANTKGPTFRKHKEAFDNSTRSGKIALLQENTSMIKRPVLENKGKVLAFGFDEATYSKLK
jgi:Spx/MgsR family transcriptional regulator